MHRHAELKQIIRAILSEAAPESVSQTLSGKKIAILGDSHVAEIYQFGKQLEIDLKSLGASVQRFGWGGSSANAWINKIPVSGKTRTIDEVKAGGPYDVSIISLGTNDSANYYRNFVETRGKVPTVSDLAPNANTIVSRITDISNQIGATYQVWVGPPSVTGKIKWYDPVAVAAVRAASSNFPGIYIDSSDIPSDADGVHVSKATSVRWSAKVVKKISEIVK